MTPEELTRIELSNNSDKGLRGELSLWGYEPSAIIRKEILVNMLLEIYFGGGE
jgi:hypothetical protein